MVADPGRWRGADPFDLPEWLGSQPLTWLSDTGLDEPLVRGHVAGGDGSSLPLDLLAADVAYPSPALTEQRRIEAHQAWRLGEVLLVVDERHALAVPSSRFDAVLACEVMRRFAKSQGIDAAQLRVCLSL
ncbi:MAG: hypothetical protein ACRDP1_17125 [Nocardioidaceae bacterium]